MNIIVYTVDKELGIFNSLGESCRKPPYTEFLLKDYGDVIKCFSNIDYDVANLLALILDPEEMRQLSKLEKLYIAPYHLTYFPNKFFSIAQGFSKGRPYSPFCDISQYDDRLDKVTNDHSVELCLEKAMLAKEVAQQVYNALTKLGCEPDSLISPANVFVKAKIDSLDLPDINDIPDGALQLAQKCAKGNWLEAYKRGHYEKVFDYDLNCYSDDTECLTINGWKYIKDTTIDELIMTFNPKTERCNFQPIKHLHKSEYNGEMVNINTTKVDILVTPNHKILLQEHVRSNMSKAYKTLGYHHYGDWEDVLAKDLPNGNFRLPISFPIEDRKEYPISDEMLKLIAWINTEGWAIRNKRGQITAIGIAQSESSEKNIIYCQEIEDILQTSNLSYSHNKRNSIYKHEIPLVKNAIYIEHHILQAPHTFRIKSESFGSIPLDKNNIHFIPMWILQYCSLRQLQLFYETLLKGDGSQEKSKYNEQIIKTSFYTKLIENKDRMMYLCHLLGHKVSYHPPDKSHSTYQIFIRPSNRSDDLESNPNKADVTYGDHINKVSYNGFVYCPTVDDGYIVIRRNQKSCICGNSAYSSFAANLYDIRRGKWIQSKEYQPEAVYGYCNAEVSIDTDFSPILYKAIFDNERDELTYTPNKVFEAELTKSKLDLLDKYNIGFGTITDAWWWIPDKSKPQYQPLKGMINWLYDKKQTAEGMDRKIDKRVMAGAFYGIFLQRKGSGLGEHFLSCWGAEIEAQDQCKVFSTIMDNHLEKHLLHIAVDGFISDKEMVTPFPNKIGEWRLSYQGKALVCGSGLVAVEGKIGEGDFSVSYDWLYNKINENPQATSYKMSKNTILTLGKAINENRLNELGGVITVERIVDCLSENKRDYARIPNCGGDLLTKHYHSQPWSKGMIDLMTGQSKEDEENEFN
jgi:hypothetical protein